MADDLRLLQLAFTIHMAEQILGSDLDIVDSEAAWLHATFPPELLRQTGFVDDDGKRTERYTEARDRAVVELPHALHEVDKLAVMELLVGAPTWRAYTGRVSLYQP